MLLGISFIAFGFAAWAHKHALDKAFGALMIANRPALHEAFGLAGVWTGVGLGLAAGAGSAIARAF